MGRQVYVQAYETAKEGKREEALGETKKERDWHYWNEWRIAPINPMLMTQSWSVVTMCLRSDFLKAGTKTRI